MVVQTVDSPGVPLLPPIAFVICLLSGVAAELHYALDITFLSRSNRMVFGGVLLAGGFWVLAKGFILFMQAKTDPITTHPASTLVTTGIYQYSRNPMYIGEITLLGGLGVLIGTYWIVLGAVALGLYLRYHVIRREEAYLLRRFGNAYTTYRSQVNRWWTI